MDKVRKEAVSSSHAKHEKVQVQVAPALLEVPVAPEAS